MAAITRRAMRPLFAAPVRCDLTRPPSRRQLEAAASDFTVSRVTRTSAS